jgi:phage terminase small subunit
MSARPRYLGPEGRKAWDKAVGHVTARRGDLAALHELALAFARASDRSAKAFAAWHKEGEPLTIEWPNGTISSHPALRAVEDAERAVLRCARALGLTVPGPALRPAQSFPEGQPARPRLVQDIEKRRRSTSR